MRLLAIDPGYEQTAVIGLEGEQVITSSIASNDVVLQWLRGNTMSFRGAVIEQVACYGMAVGAEVFETCVWTGRFMEALDYGNVRCKRLKRLDVKMHLCHDSRASDSNIRAALIDRYGPGKEAAIGVKAKPGPLYGIKADLWAALAVGVTAADTVFASVPAGVEGAA